ncbi:hypothetical protein [Cryobacterium sp. CG_9.6]|uniref:hypothetical protein n=1 Tax=Cryobacterium sp. CG_9.6 TaxID=2760710 RepID=UPI002474E053|nr:hypothetical protein [Cryobacterium sp. CG_9.6]MDH6238531.1 hypothetical protein [Cryobacterium sp. CG_9.6]
MNRSSVTLATAGVVLIAAVLTGCQAAGSSAPAPSAGASSGATSGAGSVLPVAGNPISNTSTTPGLSIVSAAVEDNVDPSTKKAINDRLQITLANATAAPLTNVEIYYEMTDTTTKQSEGYYSTLTGITIPANGETIVYFDNETASGHFPENTFSLYRSSANQVDFTIEASADGVQIASGTASKGAGTGEQAD